MAEATFVAQHEGARARVWIPVNEPRSAGTYRAEVVWPDGSSSSTQAQRDGMIVGVWLVDLDGDGIPELVVATSSADSTVHGSVEVYERRDAALAAVDVKPLGEDQRGGYMGHDVFSVEGGHLHRSYPVYLEGDSNATPTGDSAAFRYSLSDSAWVNVGGARGESH